MNKPHLEVTAGLIWKQGKVLITKRPVGTHMQGYWEFPGGKKEQGETLEQCLRRELVEELGIEVEVLEQIAKVCHEYKDRVIVLHAFTCKALKGQIVARECQEIRWVNPERLHDYSFPPPDMEIIHKILGKRVETSS